MSNGLIVTTEGKKLALDRTFNASPTRSAPTVFMVGTGTNTPVIGDTSLQTPVDITPGVQIKTFLSGYPSLDYTSLQTTIRCNLLTTEANGNILTEFGLFNTDGSPVCFSRSVFTGITKTTSVQVIFLEKNKVI